MGDERQLSKFIERIYESALDRSVWDRLLPDIFDHFKSSIGGLYAPYLVH